MLASNSEVDPGPVVHAEPLAFVVDHCPVSPLGEEAGEFEREHDPHVAELTPTELDANDLANIGEHRHDVRGRRANVLTLLDFLAHAIRIGPTVHDNGSTVGVCSIAKFDIAWASGRRTHHEMLQGIVDHRLVEVEVLGEQMVVDARRRLWISIAETRMDGVG